MKLRNELLLAAGVLAAVLMAIAAPARSAHAQAIPTPGTLTFFKQCEDGLTGTFPVFLDFEFSPDDITEPNGQVDEDDDFDRLIFVTCGVNRVLDADDLADVLAYVELVCGGNDCPVGFEGTIALTEFGLPPGTTTEYAGNFEGICDGAGTLDIVDTTGELGAFFGDEGLLCEITNTPGDDDGDDGDDGIDIDIDNNNNNVIDIDNTNTNNNVNNNTNINENKNENKNINVNTNTNTQSQSNNQSQDNSNNQTNNINSSPHVNIDFD